MTTTRSTESMADQPTLLLAFDLGQRHWTLGFMTGTRQTPRTREIPARDMARVEREIAAAKHRWGLPAEARVVSCYEAGREGFWLHRWLVAHGVDSRVVDSSSIEVPRRARRAKSDKLDTGGLLRLLRRDVMGEPHVWSVVRVPSIEAEDRRQRDREIATAKGDRTRVRNRIRGLLAAQGIHVTFDARVAETLRTVRTGDGQPLPPLLHARVTRELVALAAVQTRIRSLETERRRQVTADPVSRRLQQLRGIGANGAACLTTEVFGWRTFTSGRQVGAMSGLTPTPYRSGALAREQGISKSGNRRVRAMAVELAWCWRQFQPQSELSRWYARRFGHGTSRLARIGIVALARRLLIALWRYVETGVVPAGAQLKPSM
jgi:transposase